MPSLKCPKCGYSKSESQKCPNCREAWLEVEAAPSASHNSASHAIARIENMLNNWKHFDLRQVELTL